MEFEQFDRMICVSGDGLLNELINGIMQRPDWAKVARIPLGVIPAGSGNAVATSMGYPDPVRHSTSPLTWIKETLTGLSIWLADSSGLVHYSWTSACAGSDGLFPTEAR